jgi:hypothetical protein
MKKFLLAGALAAAVGAQALAVDQTVPGTGNAEAMQVAGASPLVQGKVRYLEKEAATIGDQAVRDATLDAIGHAPCVQHRAGVDAAKKKALLDRLAAEGLYAPADASAFPGGASAGIFPPVLDEGSSCPKLPQLFFSAPGSSFGGHHGHPGGLPVHEAFNERSSLSLGANYQAVYGKSHQDDAGESCDHDFVRHSGLEISHDVLVAAPIWHDWAKTIVFQWNADGSEFKEFSFGGKGTGDGFGGSAGDSRTGAHHVLGVAEAIKRHLPADLVITQACAHSNPTYGNEYKVVNWIRAAAIIAGADPVAEGYLTRLPDGTYRLPALRKLGEVAMPASSGNFLPEYVIHNLSDADYIFTGPSLTAILEVLKTLAPRYGFTPPGPTDDPTHYNWGFRNRVLAQTASERLYFLYANGGVKAVQEELDGLRKKGAI